MKITLITISILLSSFSFLFGQTISHDIITSAGDNSSNGVNINWTLGEPIIETASNGLIVSQGFQQTKTPFDFTYIPFLPFPNLSVTVFPNPTSQKVNISINESNAYTFKIRLFNMNGIIMLEKTSKSDYTEVDLSNLPRSVYVLLIFCVETGAMTQFKIEKIQ